MGDLMIFIVFAPTRSLSYIRLGPGFFWFSSSDPGPDLGPGSGLKLGTVVMIQTRCHLSYLGEDTVVGC